MPLYQLLTDRTLAEASAITPTTLIHIVTTADTRQNPAGSSYKAELGQLAGLFSGGSVSGDYLPLSGGTVSGATNFTNGLTANTFSASSIFVNGVQITGDTFVTGATYSAGTAIFTNNQGNQFNLTGLTEPFSGGSGNCIADLYVSNIHSCSPLNINPLDEGEVYFGSTSGVTIDVTNSRLGIGTTTPTELLHLKSAGAARIRIEADTDDTPEPDNAEILMSQDGGNTKANISLTPDTNNDLMIGVNAGAGTTPDIRFNTKSDGLTFTTSADTKVIIKNDGKVGIGINDPQYFLQVFSGSSQLFYNPTSSGGVLVVSGSTNLPRYAVNIPAFSGKLAASATFGVRAWNDISSPSYGKVGDAHLYSSVESNGLNIVSAPGSGTEDYIRFFAGNVANTTPDIYVQGSGVTRGYVGIGTDTPSEKLDVNGKTKTTNFQMTNGATNGYVLTSDASGNASWQIPTGGGGTFTGGTVSGATNFTNGLTANTISATTLTVNGVQITGDTFVTGGTFLIDTITFTNNQNNTFQVTGITASGTTFTGGSGNCIADLYVTNIHGCSPITIYDSIRSTGSTVSGLTSFSFGFETSATTDYSHAKGYQTLASGVASSAEGFGTIASGDVSKAEGVLSVATEYGAKAEGGYSNGIGYVPGGKALAWGSHAEGTLTIASGVSSHSEGVYSVALGWGSHAEGGYIDGGPFSGGTAIGMGSHAEGRETIASGNSSHSEGQYTVASGTYSHSEGELTTASGIGSHSEGQNTIASGWWSHAEGGPSSATTFFAHSEGSGTLAQGVSSHAEGVDTTTNALAGGSHAEGWGTIAYEQYQHVSGQFNNTTNANQYFIIGRGTSNAARANALRVSSNGNLNIAGTLTQSSADYAEYFESLNGENIPFGTVVELENDKIKICENPNNAIGVISASPSIVGNAEEGTADEWVGKYEKDEWGRKIMEDYTYDILIGFDENGNKIFRTVTKQRYKFSENFDPNVEYVKRENRPEWNIVGLLGQVRILKNQQIPSRWIKMKDINDRIALYLIR